MPKRIDNLNDQLLQRIRRPGAICFSFLCLAACVAGPQPAPEPVAAAEMQEPVEFITVEIPRKRLPIAITLAPVGPPDLLALLRADFELSYEENRRIKAQRDWYVRHPDYMTRVLNRAQRYLPYIRAELERRGMPMEIALLPIVESAYDPFAYSHGRAAGLWQMIPGTARRFGV